ncbi:CAP domain-containing protein [Priestia abyssalis]|uniref:CAP domain-containing protein n=1 Tax=Priestia abyssalis TaxID=1221450 RepID=UPI0009957A48|nr:CAP domain-containing protein [Priestia abyssalis]
MKNRKLRFATIIGAMSFGLLATQTQADASTINCPVYSKQNVQHMNVQNVNNIDELFKKFNIQKPTVQQAAPAPQASNHVQAQPAQKAAPAPQASKEAQAQPAAAKPTAQASSVSAFEKKVVELVNQERQKQGLQALQLDTKLSDVAREKSKDMMNKNYFSHTSPTYGSPFDMMKQFGIQYRTAGENIAKGQQTPEEVMNGWMNSNGHRKNILSPNFTHIGVGYVEGSGSTYWTQMFIGK